MADLTRRYAKLAMLVRDALAARHDRLDDADIAAFVDRMQLSQQDIDGMLRFLAFDTARVMGLNAAADKYLRALTPERIWTDDPPSPIPKPVAETPFESGNPVSHDP